MENYFTGRAICKPGCSRVLFAIWTTGNTLLNSNCILCFPDCCLLYFWDENAVYGYCFINEWANSHTAAARVVSLIKVQTYFAK